MLSLQKVLGKEDRFFELLEASAQKASESVDALITLVKDPAGLQTLEKFANARRAEKAITNQISEELCKTFVTALEREDIEALSVSLYKITKNVEKLGERILLNPQALVGIDLTHEAAAMKQATEIILEMIRALRKGAVLDAIKKLNLKLQVIEGDFDNKVLEQLKVLYSGKIDAVRVIYLKDIFEMFEKTSDRCRDAGNVITQIVLKNT